MKYTIVKSESCDWYVIPKEKLNEWNEKYRYEDDLPNWAVWIPDGLISFDEYKIGL